MPKAAGPGIAAVGGDGLGKSSHGDACPIFCSGARQARITVNAISPGWTEDSVLNSLPDAMQNLIRNWHQRGWTPMGRLGIADDIGNVVALFCSERAGWITGQIIYADGGASLMSPEIPSEMQLPAEEKGVAGGSGS